MNPRKNNLDKNNETKYNEYMEKEDQQEFEDLPNEHDEIED